MVYAQFTYFQVLDSLLRCVRDRPAQELPLHWHKATGRTSYPPETERPGHHHTTKFVKLASNRISEAKKRYRAKTTAVFHWPITLHC
jgi:hypothetical protein